MRDASTICIYFNRRTLPLSPQGCRRPELVAAFLAGGVASRKSFCLKNLQSVKEHVKFTTTTLLLKMFLLGFQATGSDWVSMSNDPLGTGIDRSFLCTSCTSSTEATIPCCWMTGGGRGGLL